MIYIYIIYYLVAGYQEAARDDPQSGGQREE